MDISPDEMDVLARTVIGESADQPDRGQQAVASVVLNRLNSGKYGQNIHDIVLAPKQFTSWGDARRMIAYNPQSPEYQRAVSNIQAAAAPGAPDYSNGALNFYAPSGMPGGRPPRWVADMTNTANIGGHRFFTPASGSSNAPGQVAQADTGVTDRLLNFGGAPNTPNSEDTGVTDRLLKFGASQTQSDDQGVTDRLLKFGSPTTTNPGLSQTAFDARFTGANEPYNAYGGSDIDAKAAARMRRPFLTGIARGADPEVEQRRNIAAGIFLGGMALPYGAAIPGYAALPGAVRTGINALSSLGGAYEGYQQGGLPGAAIGLIAGHSLKDFLPAAWNAARFAVPAIPGAYGVLSQSNALKQDQNEFDRSAGAPQ